MSYPGGKSGSGIYQRLINLIPRHDVLVVPFAGHCGVTRNIRPAEHTIVIDADPAVCEWWATWRASKRGRFVEIHNCDGIEWMRFNFGLTKYGYWKPEEPDSAAEYFVFVDPPYVLSERATGRIYTHELSDADHSRLISVVSPLDAARYRVMICGYATDLYAALDPWRSIDHRVPTRGGLQDERIWVNYGDPRELHDYRHLGSCRRERERIRRRQVNWLRQLESMEPAERVAMLSILNGGKDVTSSDSRIGN